MSSSQMCEDQLRTGHEKVLYGKPSTVGKMKHLQRRYFLKIRFLSEDKKFNFVSSYFMAF